MDKPEPRNPLLINDVSSLLKLYIAQFTPSQKIAYQIAINKLETSFCIEKSVGFLKFKEIFEKDIR